MHNYLRPNKVITILNRGNPRNTRDENKRIKKGEVTTATKTTWTWAVLTS